LPQQTVHEGGFAVIHVGNDHDISNVFTSWHGTMVQRKLLTEIILEDVA
jgi:hypothetical protein